MLEMDAQGRSWKSAESMSVTYKLNGVAHKYKPDFIVDDKVVVEIKPAKMTELKINKLKFEAAREQFTKLGLEYQVVSPPAVSKKVLNDLINTGKIRIVDHLVKKFKKFIKQV